MAAAVGCMNVLALAFTVVFARVLGAAGYGSLAVLISAFIVLMVGRPGAADRHRPRGQPRGGRRRRRAGPRGADCGWATC